MSRLGAYSLAFILTTLAIIFSSSPAQARRKVGRGACVVFTSPRRGVAITAPSCTVSVNACPVVEAITFKASYYLADGQTRETTSLGRITRPPFKIVWNLSSVPNQLSSGATINAEAEYIGGKVTTHRLEGVFLGHRQPPRPSRRVSKLGRLGREDSREGIVLTGPDSSVSAHARVYWDRQNLMFTVTVKDPSYHAGLPEGVLRNSGCEILLDAAVGAHPYPTDSVISLRVPLLGEVLQRHYSPVFTPDGGYTLSARSSEYGHHHSVKTADNKGWKTVCMVPPKLLGKRLPKSVRCNLVVRIARDPGTVSVLTWQGNNKQLIYSPFLWGTLILKDKPLMQKPLVLLVAGFIIGLIGVLVAFPLAAYLGTVRGMVLTFEPPEGEKKIADMIQAHVDSKVPDKETTLNTVAAEFSLEEKHVDRLLRKYFGESFHPHVMSLRIEVAKERLRSSNASESTIAELCGFKSVEEMERMFLRYSKMTPYKFRLENQVT